MVNYGFVWNGVDKKYEWNAEWVVRKQEALAKKHEVQTGVEVAVGGVDQVAEGASGGGGQVLGELGGGDRDVRVCDFREDLKACASMKSKVSCRDFVNKFYEEKCKSLDMKRVDEICDEFGKLV